MTFPCPNMIYTYDNDEYYNETFEEDLALEKDVDPLKFLRVHYELMSQQFNEQSDDTPSSNKSRKIHTCHICLKEYVGAKGIRAHLLRIHNIEPPQGSIMHECPECHQKFSDKSQLDRHMLKHTGIRPHVCLKCNKGFFRREHLTRHQLRVKCDEIKVKNESGSDTLKKEAKKKLPKKEMASKETEESQLQDTTQEDDGSELLTILKVERVRTEFPQCKICSKKFVHPSHLRVHMKTHNIPPTKFECPICGKNLSRKDHLSHHIKKLHGNHDSSANSVEESIPGNYSCDLCPKTFTESAKYNKHLAMHKNNQLKKEICDICNNIFLSKWHVRKHKLHKHNIEPENGCLACVFCEKKFIDNYYLKRHYNSKHKNEPFPHDNPFAIITRNEENSEDSHIEQNVKHDEAELNEENSL